MIIAGSRSLSLSVAEIDAAIARLDPGGLLWYPEEWWAIVSGCAPGMDLAGEAWAAAKGKAVLREPITETDWGLGRYLGPKARNHRMSLVGDGALIFWDRRSGGSADMAARMLLRDKPVRVIDCGPWRPPAVAVVPRKGVQRVKRGA